MQKLMTTQKMDALKAFALKKIDIKFYTIKNMKWTIFDTKYD